MPNILPAGVEVHTRTAMPKPTPTLQPQIVRYEPQLDPALQAQRARRAARAAAAAGPVTIYHNGNVHTVDDEMPMAQGTRRPTRAGRCECTASTDSERYPVMKFRPAPAFAVRDNLFVAVGSDAAVLAQFPEARRVNLLGQTVLPGLIDSHVHLLGLGVMRQTANLVGATSLDEIRQRIEYAVDGMVGTCARPSATHSTRYVRACSDPNTGRTLPRRPTLTRRGTGCTAWAGTRPR